MARNGSGVYSLPAGSTVTNGDTSDATDINTPLADLESDANVARPIVAGGTGATSATNARTNLGLGASDGVNFGKLTLGTNGFSSASDIALRGNSIIAGETSTSMGFETSGYFRVGTITDFSTGGAGFAELFRVKEGAIDVNGVSIWAQEVVIADDSVATIDLPDGRSGAWVFVGCAFQEDNVQNVHSGIVQVDAGSTNAINTIYAAGSFNTQLGTLTGTTGANGWTTVAVAPSSNQIQIEYRGGGSRSFQVVML